MSMRTFAIIFFVFLTFRESSNKIEEPDDEEVKRLDRDWYGGLEDGLDRSQDFGKHLRV